MIDNIRTQRYNLFIQNAEAFETQQVYYTPRRAIITKLFIEGGNQE